MEQWQWCVLWGRGEQATSSRDEICECTNWEDPWGMELKTLIGKSSGWRKYSPEWLLYLTIIFHSQVSCPCPLLVISSICTLNDIPDEILLWMCSFCYLFHVSQVFLIVSISPLETFALCCFPKFVFVYIVMWPLVLIKLKHPPKFCMYFLYQVHIHFIVGKNLDFTVLHHLHINKCWLWNL